MLAEQRAERIMIIDCDVHQGDGTAAIFSHEPKVFTFSIHGSHNFPVKKQQSDLDIGLADGTDDRAYLAALEEGMNQAFARMLPNLVIYLAGADPYEDDRYGRLSLTKSGLARRDARVLDRCGQIGASVAVTMAGGYARRLDDVVDIHLQTVYEASRHSKP
jgi:acetoin utilization deacetylase AcuC-like enzyme